MGAAARTHLPGLPVVTIGARYLVSPDQVRDLIGEEAAVQWGVTPGPPPRLPRRWRICARVRRARYAAGVRVGSWIAGRRLTGE